MREPNRLSTINHQSCRSAAVLLPCSNPSADVTLNALAGRVIYLSGSYLMH